MTSKDRTGDELAIRNLLAELVWHADNSTIAELDGYVACFTDDAEWEMSGEVKRGHDEIRSGAVDRRERSMMGPGSNVMHFLACSWVTFGTGNSARAKSYIQAYRDTHQTPKLAMMGQYHDEFRHTPDGWKLARRLVDFGARTKP